MPRRWPTAGTLFSPWRFGNGSGAGAERKRPTPGVLEMPDASFLHHYARLATELALPIEPRQHPLIVAPPETHRLVHIIAEAAFKRGAADVSVLYEDSAFGLLRTASASPERLRVAAPPWLAETLTQQARSGQPVLTLHAPSPQLSAHVSAERTAHVLAARNHALEAYGSLRSQVAFNWSVMAVATREWATFLRPELSEEAALEWLWERLGHLLRLDMPDPLAAWQGHAQRLMQRCAQLDELELSAPGTDLRLGLPEKHRWFGPLVPSTKGVSGVPNLPTEEISTLPHRQRADGTVAATRPLVVEGQLVENLALTFREGRVSSFHCTTGSELVQRLLETDEGANRLGEVALVPENSLVAQERRTFYSTLIDENASCHLALGRAYPVVLTDGQKMTRKAFEQRGGNYSRVHLDFMFGSSELTVDALTRRGERLTLLRQGRWVLPE